MTKRKDTLTAAEEIACQQYVLNGGDQSAAFREAYPHSVKWKDASVHSRASKLFKLAKVQSRVSELQAMAAKVADEKFKIDAEYVLRRHHEIDTMDVADILDKDGHILPIREWPRVWRQTLSGMDVAELWDGKGEDRDMVGILKKIKWPDKVKNLELLGKHRAVCAYREQIALTDPEGGTFKVIHAEMPPDEAALLYKTLVGA